MLGGGAAVCASRLAARSIARSSALGPSGGAGWSLRVSVAVSMIRPSVRPRSSIHRRTWVLAGQPCHQAGRVPFGSMPSAVSSSAKNRSESISRACASSSSFTGLVKGSLTRLYSGFRRWLWGKSGDGTPGNPELAPSGDSGDGVSFSSMISTKPSPDSGGGFCGNPCSNPRI